MLPKSLTRPYSRQDLEKAGAHLIAYGTGLFAFIGGLILLQLAVLISFSFGNERWYAVEWLGLGGFLVLSIIALKQRYTGIWLYSGRLVVSQPFSVFTYTTITTTLDRMWRYPWRGLPLSAIRVRVGERATLKLYDAVILDEGRLPFQYQKGNL